jgi:CheY-like chemotaxis protein
MRGNKISVLVIDDEPAISKSVEMILGRAEYEVHATRKSREALSLARDTMPDVILCDAKMPGLSGTQVISLLKADEKTAEIPVILITASPEAGDPSRLPVAAFLPKPFQAETLKAAIDNAVRR